MGGGYRGTKSAALREPHRQHAVYHTRLLPGDGHSVEDGTRSGGERRRDGAAGGGGQRVVRAALLAGTECDRTEFTDRLRNSHDCGSGGQCGGARTRGAERAAGLSFLQADARRKPRLVCTEGAGGPNHGESNESHSSDSRDHSRCRSAAADFGRADSDGGRGVEYGFAPGASESAGSLRGDCLSARGRGDSRTALILGIAAHAGGRSSDGSRREIVSVSVVESR